MQQHRIITLLQQKVSGRMSSAEWAELSTMLDEEQFADWEGILLADMLSTQPDTHLDTTRWEAVLAKVMAVDKLPTADLQSAASSLPDSPAPVHRIHFLKTAWFRYAAILFLFAGTATFLYLNNQPQEEITLKKSSFQQDLAPGGNKAILTLADGSTIMLDSAANGHLAIQGTTQILKLSDGSLAYNAKGARGEELYNTITTPKGGQYQIVLPDGSKVWLNAASSIRFPAVFVKDRKVSITGEAYLEVVKDKTKPFQVISNAMTIDVLGTSFNINAYTDEDVIKATLMEGSVKVLHDNSVILKPGEQAALKNNKINVNHADVQQVLAWKNGLFNFEGATVEELMRQLARWYDLEIVYNSSIPRKIFHGDMGRDLKLSQVLKVITRFNIQYTVEGRKLTIYNGKMD